MRRQVPFNHLWQCYIHLDGLGILIGRGLKHLTLETIILSL